MAVVLLVAVGATGAWAASPAGGGTAQTRGWFGFAWSDGWANGPLVSPFGRIAERRDATAIAARSRKPAPISPAAAFILPSQNQCVSGRTLTIQVRKLSGVKWLLVSVSVNGRHVKTITLRQTTKPVRLTGLPTGTFLLSITARTTDGRRVSTKRTYRTCGKKTPPSSYTLSVALAGTGSGSVTGSGISCPGSCSHSYAAGTKATLSAAAGSGSSFAGWSGGGCSGTGACTLTMTSAQAIKATFTTNPEPSYTLTVGLAGTGSGSVTGSGVSCPGSCSHSYTAGTVVTLTAAAASGSSFAGWSGAGCSGTGTCTVTMSSAQAVTATFTTNPPPSYTLTVGLAGTGSGSVTGSGISCPGTCSDGYTAGTVVTLTAAAASGSSFAGWSGAGCSGDRHMHGDDEPRPGGNRDVHD